MEEQKKTDAELAQERLSEELQALGEKLSSDKYRGRTYTDDVKLETTGSEFKLTTYSVNMINKKLEEGLVALENLYKYFSQVSDMVTIAQRDLMYQHLKHIDQEKTISESEQKTDEAEKSTKVVKLKTGK